MEKHTNKSSPTPEQKTQLNENTEQLKKVTRQLKKQNSFPAAFMRGVTTALGATLGVSIILAIIVFAIDQVAKAFGVENVTHDLLQTLHR